MARSFSMSLERVLRGGGLSVEEAEALMGALAEEAVHPALAGALLAALRARGERPQEVRGFARALRKRALDPGLTRPGPYVDIVGTGGDGSGSLNLSTGAALLAAAAGLTVVKHGNRAVSSRSGSADVLEALGLTLSREGADAALTASGFTFLFAPHYHPAMKAVAPVRRAMGVRTIFNVLGPLVNPAAPSLMLVGAYSPAAARLMAEALSALDVERAYVVHGAPGWDEPTPVGPFLRLSVRPGVVVEETIDPLDYGVPRCAPEALAGGDAAENAAALTAVLRGERTGPARDALVLGCALALEIAGLASGREATEAASAAIDDGRAATTLARLGGAA